jgi:hypothetical protein
MATALENLTLENREEARAHYGKTENILSRQRSLLKRVGRKAEFKVPIPEKHLYGRLAMNHSGKPRCYRQMAVEHRSLVKSYPEQGRA